MSEDKINRKDIFLKTIAQRMKIRYEQEHLPIKNTENNSYTLNTFHVQHDNTLEHANEIIPNINEIQKEPLNINIIQEHDTIITSSTSAIQNHLNNIITPRTTKKQNLNNFMDEYYDFINKLANEDLN